MCVILLDIAKARAIEFFTYLYATSEVWKLLFLHLNCQICITPQLASIEFCLCYSLTSKPLPNPYRANFTQVFVPEVLCVFWYPHPFKIFLCSRKWMLFSNQSYFKIWNNTAHLRTWALGTGDADLNLTSCTHLLCGLRIVISPLWNSILSRKLGKITCFADRVLGTNEIIHIKCLKLGRCIKDSCFCC